VRSHPIADTILAALLVAAWTVVSEALAKKPDAVIVFGGDGRFPIVRKARLNTTEVPGIGTLTALSVRVGETPDDALTPTDAEFDEWLLSESKDLEAWLAARR